MKNIIRAITFSFLFCFASCSEDKGTENKDASKINANLGKSEVQVMLVKKQDYQDEIISNSKLSAVHRADVLFLVDETINKILINNGDYVKKSQKLVELDNFLLKNKLEQSKIQLEKAKVAFNDFLIGQGYDHKSLDKIPEAIINTGRIKSDLASSDNEYNLMLHNYRSTIVSAPIAGIIANLNVKENNKAQAGSVFCTILGTDEFYIVFPVMEDELGKVKKGMEILVKPYFNPDISIVGRISEINPIVDNSGLIYVKALINNFKGKLYEGMNVKVSVKLGRKENISVPKSALLIRDGKKVVFTSVNGKASWNYVKTGAENSHSIVITEGIAIGDSVIIGGNSNLAHGSDIKVDRKL